MSDTTTETVKLYNIHDGLTGRDGGPYMDQVDAVQAERVRAEVENRKPNLDNPPGTAGQVLVTGSQLLTTSGAVPASKQNSTVNLQEITAKPVREVEVEVIEQGPVFPLSPMTDPDGEPVDYDPPVIETEKDVTPDASGKNPATDAPATKSETSESKTAKK